jgi:hypothetical protein
MTHFYKTAEKIYLVYNIYCACQYLFRHTFLLLSKARMTEPPGLQCRRAMTNSAIQFRSGEGYPVLLLILTIRANKVSITM